MPLEKSYGPAKQKKYTTFNLKAHNTGASISEGVNKARGSTTELGRTTTVRLDKLFYSTPRVELVKVDAEGFDPFVLRGLEFKLQSRSVQLIYWEYNEHWTLASAHTYDGTVSWLSEYDFVSYVVGKTQMIPVSDICMNATLLRGIQDTHNVLSILKTSKYLRISNMSSALNVIGRQSQEPEAAQES
eukprot:CAMPEP_0118925712 /NCGR_PEP_ID=MMETSP1169-20130426/3551_1 /TAXON_ID=36882 /ORGANISM="Pyramimonas obovata, Strain CCMP722" /LENGTH=186 /DNA_ID=CAMNT_0006867087 /DNA_START=497 /DNA_END=1057 /DNA_ORIENTATION=-